MVRAKKGLNLQCIINFQFHTLSSGIYEQLSTAGKLSKHEGYRYLHRSFITYNRLFYAQCTSSGKCLSIRLRRSRKYPFFPQAAGAVPLAGLLPEQVSTIVTNEMGVLVFDIMPCPSLASKLDLPGSLTASQAWSTGVFTRHYLRPVCTD